MNVIPPVSFRFSAQATLKIKYIFQAKKKKMIFQKEGSA